MSVSDTAPFKKNPARRIPTVCSNPQIRIRTPHDTYRIRHQPRRAYKDTTPLYVCRLIIQRVILFCQANSGKNRERRSQIFNTKFVNLTKRACINRFYMRYMHDFTKFGRFFLDNSLGVCSFVRRCGFVKICHFERYRRISHGREKI